MADETSRSWYGSVDGKTRNHRNGQRGKHAGGHQSYRITSGRSIHACGGKAKFTDNHDVDREELESLFVQKSVDIHDRYRSAEFTRIRRPLVRR